MSVISDAFYYTLRMGVHVTGLAIGGLVGGAVGVSAAADAALSEADTLRAGLAAAGLGSLVGNILTGAVVQPIAETGAFSPEPWGDRITVSDGESSHSVSYTHQVGSHLANMKHPGKMLFSIATAAVGAVAGAVAGVELDKITAEITNQVATPFGTIFGGIAGTIAGYDIGHSAIGGRTDTYHEVNAIRNKINDIDPGPATPEEAHTRNEKNNRHLLWTVGGAAVGAVLGVGLALGLYGSFSPEWLQLGMQAATAIGGAAIGSSVASGVDHAMHERNYPHPVSDISAGKVGLGKSLIHWVSGVIGGISGAVVGQALIGTTIPPTPVGADPSGELVARALGGLLGGIIGGHGFSSMSQAVTGAYGEIATNNPKVFQAIHDSWRSLER